MIDGLVGWPWLHSDLGVGGLETARGARTPNEKKAYVQLNEFFFLCWTVLCASCVAEHVADETAATESNRLRERLRQRSLFADRFHSGA